MKLQSKKNVKSRQQHGISRIIEDILGCKWTVAVLRSISRGIVRPGELTRHIPGISTKVLNERLKKLMRYSIISRKTFNQIPPKVEYRLTALGRRITAVLRALEKIELDLKR